MPPRIYDATCSFEDEAISHVGHAEEEELRHSARKRPSFSRKRNGIIYSLNYMFPLVHACVYIYISIFRLLLFIRPRVKRFTYGSLHNTLQNTVNIRIHIINCHSSTNILCFFCSISQIIETNACEVTSMGALLVKE